MLLGYEPLVGEHESLVDVVFPNAEKTVQGTVDPVVLARLHPDGYNRETLTVVNQIVDLAQLLVVVLEEFVSMGPQLLCDHSLVHRPEVDAGHVFQNRHHIGAV